jgi:uncharacterized repeat protein (TIGR01451 family)
VRRRVRTALAIALAATPFWVGPAAAAGTSQPEPTSKPTSEPKQSFALRIRIDDGRTHVRTGDRLTYTIKVGNTGAEQTPELLLTQSLLPGIKLISSRPKGVLSRGQVVWNKVLPPGKTAQLSVTVEVGRLPVRQQRLAAIACASNKANGRPIVCASHLDLVAGTQARGSTSRLTGFAHAGLGFWCGIGGAGLLVAGSASILYRRRRSPTTG